MREAQEQSVRKGTDMARRLPVIRVMADTRKSTRAGDARRDGARVVPEFVSSPSCPVDLTQFRYSTA